ncbi:efflux transporter outer membrane subunit [Burkholderia pseudomultivorans]|uniref:Solvent efflux pump outer membrane protein SrpC n=1 Tax=Burkholderia pseudomultivorans TaxID=1207504 RepID=A0ABU2E8B9_9BURK|nr:efflux transporter outer membrane subunit [Burkholderia pseudomultivorans]MDR8727084.1 Solvent efflux pump outer membrane protein SrpC [Burkholderia pseudomultivorans]MDR8733076.1 Solvent efflux pump outer membrane protein SrpC [Burkholderia pseudomultivorans]MDR8739943.1 Solvent efflux pump outer membrane protein SrpC [Burkholderia pseudomultivorans]MDR8755778.1 Solvent efflux pump outer membrane protein SrpC [Burkholderia pseudomultivorans]MDR8776049.1 Solvent efflux pump outer membrane p
MSVAFRLSALAMSAMLAACAVGPDFKRPDTVTAARFARDAHPSMQYDAAPPDASAEADAAFWRGFGDPALTRLIDAALAANQDLQAAVSRYDASNALLSQAAFDRYPTITASGQIGHQLSSKDQAFGAPRSVRDTPVSSVGINAAWELDLFGRVRRSIESQRAETAASAADLRAVRVAIAGEVASTYVDLRGSQARLRIARDNAANQQQTLALINARVGAGRGSELDAARARAQYEATTSRIAVYEAAIGVDEHRLAVLTGQTPDALIGRFDAPAPLPVLAADVDPGTPGDLLRRRPDVAAAEARLHAATARVGVATADLFPRFTLSGLLGSATNSYGFFRAGSDTNLIALGIDWSFLDVGRVRARIAASDAEAAGQLAQYRQTVLGALEETENALLRVARSRDETAHLVQAASDSARAAQLAQVRFSAGAIDYYEVLDAQRTLLQAQDAAADARMRSATATVALYKALAGGWPSGDGPGASGPLAESAR